MKKIEKVIESCWNCRSCVQYRATDGSADAAFICKIASPRRLIYVGVDSTSLDIPDWCPLETYEEAEQSEAQPTPAVATPCTIILPGMPGLEWMTENLSGFGGTEIDGNTYYTYDEAEEAVKQLGNGWRLPTRGEMVDLDDLGSTWDDERKGRWFGGNHATDHKDSLFIPAAGYRNRETGALNAVGTHGYAWSSSSYAAGSYFAGNLYFHSGRVNPLNGNGRAYGFPVRCVRNVK